LQYVQALPGAAQSSLGRRAGLGAAWVLLAFAISRLLGFATNLVLARLLSPSDFGVVGFAMVTIGAFTLLQDLGTPAAIIYGRRDVREVGGTALTINVAAALLLFGGVALAAPWLAQFGGHEAIGPVVNVLALGLVISSLGSVQNALLVKELALRRKFLPDVVPLIASGVASIGLAMLGFGVWSLVYGYLAKSLATTLLLWWLSSVRPWPRLNRSVAVELLGYGQHVSLTSLIGFATLNVDYLIVGRYLGSTELGLYTMAFMMATLPAKAISELASKVTFPAYARLQGDAAAMTRLFTQVLGTIAPISILIALAISITAPLYVPILLGEKWAGIVVPLQVLSAFAALQSIGYNFPAAYKAIGRPSLLWKLNLLKLVLEVPPMLLVVSAGVTGIAIVHVAAEAAMLPIYVVVLARSVDLPAARFWRPLVPTMLASAAAGLVVALAWVLPPETAASAGPQIGVALAAMAAYGIVMAAADRRIVKVARARLVLAR
jgi:lipopolysaccharide exporter